LKEDVMRNKRKILIASVLVAILVVACIAVAGPVLLDSVRAIHVIPAH
jgi:hypothetical protein